MSGTENADAILREMLERNSQLKALNPGALKGGRPEGAPDRKQASKAIGYRRAHPERDFQDALIDLLHVHGWRVAAVRHARTLKGWRTPWEADGKGMQDLIAVRERVIWAELKVPGGVISPRQQMWHDWLIAAGQEAYIWYPKDWDTIEQCLGRRVKT